MGTATLLNKDCYAPTLSTLFLFIMKPNILIEEYNHMKMHDQNTSIGVGVSHFGFIRNAEPKIETFLFIQTIYGGDIDHEKNLCGKKPGKSHRYRRKTLCL